MSDVVTVFHPSERGRRIETGKNDFMLTFIDKPRGVRFNSVLSKRFATQGIKRVRIYATNEAIIIKPTTEKETSFALIGNQHAYHVSAAAVYHWAQENAIEGKLRGEWDGNECVYKFTLDDEVSEEEVS